MKKLFLSLILFISPFSLGIQGSPNSGVGINIAIPWDEIKTNFIPMIKDLIKDGTLEKPVHRIIKTIGLTTVGLAGGFGGLYFATLGFQTYLKNDNSKNKPFYNTNAFRGLTTSCFGLTTTLASILLIAKSNQL